jgi:hypothetical protein
MWTQDAATMSSTSAGVFMQNVQAASLESSLARAVAVSVMLSSSLQFLSGNA